MLESLRRWPYDNFRNLNDNHLYDVDIPKDLVYIKSHKQWIEQSNAHLNA